MPRETIRYALRSLQYQKLRSYLNLVSIVIGVAAIVALVSLGGAVNQFLGSQLSLLGREVLLVEPGNLSNPAQTMFSRIEKEDIGVIENLAGVEAVIAFYEAGGIVSRGRDEAGAFFLGIDPAKRRYLEETGYLKILKGRFLRPGDRYAILVDEDFVANAFDTPVGVRQNIRVKGKKFSIVGILQKNTLNSSFGTNLVWIPEDTFKETFAEQNPMELMVKVVSAGLVDGVAEKIEATLERVHNEKRVSVLTPDNMSQQLNAILGSAQVFVLFIAAISLVVGALGIANTMLMNVLHRTREIGVMKAVGATDRQVLMIFALEAFLMGAAGGFIGSIVGYVIALLAGVAAAEAGFPLVVGFSPLVVAGATLLAGFVGLVAGIVPARRAARLDPTEALRWE